MKQKLGIVLITAALIFIAAPYLQAAEQPIVVYSLQFIELNRELTQSLQAKFSVNKAQKNKKWQVISKDDVLNYIHKEGKFSALLRGGSKQESSQVHYNSWLTAVNKKQAEIKLKEKLINESGETGQAHLNFYFQPVQLEAEKNRVLTKIKFSYQGREGEQAELETKSWISQQKKKPIAVVTQKIKADNGSARRYFVLYLKGTTVSSEAVKKQNALVAMGDLKEVNQLFARQDTSAKSSNLALAGYLGKKAAVVEGSWGMNKYKLGGEVRKNKDELMYRVNIGYSLLKVDDLFLVGRFARESPEKEEPTIRLGLRDKVIWRDLLAVEAAYFPAAYQLGKGLKQTSQTKIKLSWKKQRWKAWYTGRYRADNYFNAAGLSYNLTSNWGIEGKWRESYSKNGKFYLGISWSLNE